MNKTRILLIQIAGCLALGAVLGIAFWICDGGETCKKLSDCSGGVSDAQAMASENKTMD